MNDNPGYLFEEPIEQRDSSRHHEVWEPCPITGEPNKTIYTDHNLPGVFNACDSCGNDKRSVAERLVDLNENRRQEETE